MVGTTLGHYRIVRLLGRGGMGEVFVAEDTRLHRQVALKVLPAAAAADPDYLARFQREAQAIAALNHPNVVTVHSIEQADGTHFLTMELVEGTTLATLIPRRGFPLAELLEIAVPLADAVSAAHAQGVVHRDLKPANVMLGPQSRVKVLDFGLAKLRQDIFGPSDGTTALTTRLTALNQVFGTPAYMSPEQAEGQPVDHRTDIFSLGVLLYEMATGTRPFKGETPMSLISSILKDAAPPVLESRPDLPADLDRIIRRCLAKDRERRYQTALDLRNDLEDLQQQTGPSRSSAMTRMRARPLHITRATLTAIAAVLLVAVAAFALNKWATRATDSVAISVAHPVFTQLTSQPAAELFPSLSPDGKWVVYAGEGAGNRDIYLQSTTGQTAINLTADSPADDEQPSFSPDGEHIAFRSGRDGGGIFVMGRTGEAVRRVTRNGFNPAWSPDGSQLAYTTGRMELRPQNSEGRSELWTVAAGGGTSRKISDGDAIQPNWSPNGKRIVFGQRLGVDRHVSLVNVALAGGEPIVMLGTREIAWNPVWSPDGRFLYFCSDRGGSMNLWRMAVDQESGQARGEPEPVTTPAPFAAHLSIASDGRRIAYSSVQETQNIQRLKFDPDIAEVVGEPENLTTGSRRWSSPDPSADGTWIAFYSQVQPEGDLYIIRADGTGLRQLTNDEAIDRVPRWSPDGEWIAAFSDRSGRLEVWKIRRDGSDLQRVTEGGGWSTPVWSPDARQLAASRAEEGRDSGQMMLLVDPQRAWSAQRATQIPPPPPTQKFVPNSWSQDGRRLVGQNGFILAGIVTLDLQTRRFERWTEFGEWPVWLPDHQRVLFVARGREFHILDTRTKATRRVFAVARDTLGPPRLTRDGRAAYFSRRVTEADIWLVNLQ